MQPSELVHRQLHLTLRICCRWQRLNSRGEVADSNHAGFSYHTGMPNDILELTNIAGPSMAGQNGLRTPCQSRQRFIVLRREKFQEVSLQDGQVFASFRKRPHFPFDHAEPEIKIFSKFALAHHLGEVPVCCGDYTNVYLANRRRSHSLDLLVL